MRDKLWSRVLVGLAVALLGAASLSAPAQADGGKLPPHGGYTAPISGTYKTAPNKPAPKGERHMVPPKASGFSTMSLTTGYHYAYGQSTTTQGSLKTTSWVAKPTGVTSPGHSLWEITAQRGSLSGGAYRDNIVEGGVAVKPGVFGDSNPHLFASAWWLNGTTSTWCGSYYGGCGWADNASNTLNVGADVSADIGTGKQVALQYQATGCVSNGPGWFLNYAGGWIGCWPTVGGAQRLGPAFTAGDFWQAFGEVNKQGTSCYQMGNGVFPTTTTSATSYFSALTHSLTGGPAGSFSLGGSDPTVYGTLAIGASPGGTFRYGGTEPAPC